MEENRRIRDIQDALADNLRMYRKKLHLTQKDLAEKSGVSLTIIKNIEQKNLSRYFVRPIQPMSKMLLDLNKLSKVLNCTSRDLMRITYTQIYHTLCESRDFGF